MSEALAVYTPEVEEKSLQISRAPDKVLEEAHIAAAALARVINGKAKPVRFNGETYLEYEDWTTLSRFYGISARVISSQPVTFGDVSGWEARAEAVHNASGNIISVADSMCLNDEPNWKSKPQFMLRSMAQTRACAKALRNVLAWVVVLAGYKPTPAEEMDGVRGFHDEQPPAPRKTAKPAAGDSLPAPADLIRKAIIKEQARLNVPAAWMKSYAKDMLKGKAWADLTQDEAQEMLDCMVANFDHAAERQPGSDDNVPTQS